MKNSLADLNNHLFEMMEKLEDDDVLEDTAKFNKEIARGRAMVQLSGQILDIARVQLSALKTAENLNLMNEDMPALLAVKDSKQVLLEARK